MTNFFKLSELSENTLIGRDVGEKTRKKIKQLIEKHQNIVIDMENKSSLSPSFVDEAIVMLVIELGKQDFSRQVKLINLNRGIKSLMNSILHDKMQKAS
jgi:hypothetical protein